jgi:hypothetical protein
VNFEISQQLAGDFSICQLFILPTLLFYFILPTFQKANFRFANFRFANPPILFHFANPYICFLFANLSKCQPSYFISFCQPSLFLFVSAFWAKFCGHFAFI